MSKKVIITNEQLNAILFEELGIAKTVTNLTKELKQKLFDSIENNDTGEFVFVDITVKYNVYSFKNEIEFFNWYESNSEKYINGFSYDEKTLFLTIIAINGDYNIASLNDTIQHELEHYYQTKMAGHNLVKPTYNDAIKKFNDYNDYVKYIARIEYYSNGVEIDAFVNGAYASVNGNTITDFNTFVETTDLKYIKNTLQDAFVFFKNAKFQGIYFNEMLEFIKRNKYYPDCNDISKLRNKICEKCQNAYKYFIRKASRAYALLKNEELEKNNVKSNLDKIKFENYWKDK